MEAEEALPGFGLFDDLPEGELHPLQIDVFQDEDESLNQRIVTKPNIYRPVKEGTELHRAIRSGRQSRIDALLDAYQKDFIKVRDYLVQKYQWDPDDQIWLRKIILVAVNEDQCRSIKDLERSHESAGHVNLEQSIIVLLQTPTDDEEAAVFHPKYFNQLELFRAVWKLFPNGYLSWDYCAEDYGRWQTFLEAAASCGNNYTIKRLHSMGAQLCLPQHNPLISACSSLRKYTIRYLLEHHFDDFDCTQREKSVNAFIILIQKNNIEVLDYVLDKMIQYRQKYYGESKSEAFNSIFRYENDDCPYYSTLTYLRPGKILKKIEEYVAEYELDLSYQNENILAHLLRKKLALGYCRIQIRQNPDLLGLMPHNGNGPTILHECIRSDELELLKDMYFHHPEVKQYFEFEYGFILLKEALDNQRNDKVHFILEHHKEFLMHNVERLEQVIFCRDNIEAFYEGNQTILSEYFPHFKEQIEDAIVEAHEIQVIRDLEHEFRQITESIKADIQNLSKYHHVLSNIRGPTGESALHFAVENDNLQLFEKLLEVGCDLDTLDNEENHPIHFVRSVDMLNLIIDRHPEGRSLINRVNSAGWSVLQKVCSLYSKPSVLIQLLETILKCGADVNHLTKTGETAAFMTWSTPVLEILMKHHINLDIVNDAGETAVLRHLHYQNTWVACTLLPLSWDHPSFDENAHKYLAPLLKTKRYAFRDYLPLLEDNPDKTKKMFDAVYQRSPEEASRLFAMACDRSRLFFVEKFLEYNYDLDFNYKDEYGYTPIMGLLNFDKENPGDLIRKLLEKNIDLEVRNQWNKTPLLIVASRFASARWYNLGMSTVQLLLDHGAQINAADDDGNTALHLAFRSSEWDLVELLIRNGADLTAKNNDGKRPWEMGTTASKKIFSLIWVNNTNDLGS